MTRRFDILTLFPEALRPFLEASLLGKAVEKKLVEFHLHQLRDWAQDKHRRVDDVLYGGGEGMVMKPEPLAAAIEEIRRDYKKGRTIYLSPQGRRLDQALVRELSSYDELLLVCGRYEGIDERILEGWIDEEISLGDFVLCGGELPAMAVVEAVTRLQPGVVGKEASILKESFADGLLEYPHYTRPPEFKGRKVPEILLQGHHGEIEAWRRREALRRTFEKRPDLLNQIDLSEEDKRFLESLKAPR
ncbi:MAG TPA: tRNA (guanosine(37)-N1)-methyltransferase TrmD [bacterium]|nr:tRNA (guanosine(37)-N1)-methyltransferase TrmD [bacterium]